MGKRLGKNDLLAEIEFEKNKLDALLEAFTSETRCQPLTEAGWSTKDILGHLIGWQELNQQWCQSEENGEIPAVPAAGFGWKDVRALNEEIYQRFREQPFAEIEVQFEKSHQKMLELIKRVNEKEFVALEHFSWTGKSWALSDYVRANTASHYRWAAKHLRKGLRRQHPNT